MQFSTVTTIFIAAIAATAYPADAAAVQALPPAAGAKKACTYEKDNYLSNCRMGLKMHCGGMDNMCAWLGKNDTFDAAATKANEDACVGLKSSSSCTMTVACC